MDSRRAKLIAEVIKHLESMDGDALKGDMHSPDASGIAIEIEPADEEMKGKMDGEGMDDKKGPMEMLADKGSDPKSEMDDDQISDDELEELARLGG